MFVALNGQNLHFLTTFYSPVVIVLDLLQILVRLSVITVSLHQVVPQKKHALLDQLRLMISATSDFLVVVRDKTVPVVTQ